MSEICDVSGLASKIDKIYIADLSELELPVIGIDVAKEITDISYNTPYNPFILVNIDKDKQNTFNELFEGEVFKQTLDFTIDASDGSDYSTLFEEIKRWCGVVVIVVKEDGSSILQGVDFVFTGFWRLMPSLTKTKLTRDLRAVNDNGGWALRIECQTRNYAPKIKDYSTIVN